MKKNIVCILFICFMNHWGLAYDIAPSKELSSIEVNQHRIIYFNDLNVKRIEKLTLGNVDCYIEQGSTQKIEIFVSPNTNKKVCIDALQPMIRIEQKGSVKEKGNPILYIFGENKDKAKNVKDEPRPFVKITVKNLAELRLNHSNCIIPSFITSENLSINVLSAKLHCGRITSNTFNLYSHILEKFYTERPSDVHIHSLLSNNVKIERKYKKDTCSIGKLFDMKKNLIQENITIIKDHPFSWEAPKQERSDYFWNSIFKTWE